MTESKSDLALALSGGGHRATLFALGALLALVDRGLNRRVVQIASVSGGSITSAFVAQRCEFSKSELGDFEELVKDLVQRVVNRGVVETRRLVLVAVLPGVLIGLALGLWGTHWLLSAGVALLLISVTLLSVGKLVEHLLDIRYFRDVVKAAALSMPDDSKKRGVLKAFLWYTYHAIRHSVIRRFTKIFSRTKAARMRSLASREVEHVFCATDLVQGQPIYISSKEGGTIWRRSQVRWRGTVNNWPEMGRKGSYNLRNCSSVCVLSGYSTEAAVVRPLFAC